jgi:hypothetical protein
VTRDEIFEELRRLPRAEQVELLKRMLGSFSQPLTDDEKAELAAGVEDAEDGDLDDAGDLFARVPALDPGAR